jgi:hypothetical protein
LPSPLQSARDKHFLPMPAFGSSPNLQVRLDSLALPPPPCACMHGENTARACDSQALAIEAGEQDPSTSGAHEAEHMTFYEITVATADQPKLLSRLSEALVSGGLEH